MNATPQPAKRPRSRAEKLWLAFGGLLIAILLGGVFTLGSLRVPFEPDSRTEFVVLFALSTFNIVALLVFGLMLVRTILRMWAERQAGKLGARFRTKMVLGAMAISLLPVVFLFFVSYALLNRTLAKWFPRPLEIATQQSRELLTELGKAEYERVLLIAKQAVRQSHLDTALGTVSTAASLAREAGADAAWELDAKGAVVDRTPATQPGKLRGDFPDALFARNPEFLRTLASGGELWKAEEGIFLAARTTIPSGQLVVGRRMPPNFLEKYTVVEAQVAAYQQQTASLRTYRNMILLTLGLFTVLVLFSSMWFALFLSKQVTVPIEALAEGTREVARGNLGHQVDVAATDELGTLVSSFNQMTGQLADSRRQVDEFTRSLQQAVAEIEQRRQLMETIQENIPTGVLSLDPAGAITRANRSVARIFGDKSRKASTLAQVMGDDAARAVEYLMRKALRLGTASKEIEIALGDRLLHAAVTVSALGPRRSNPGYVVVIDDLTDLLRAQKAAAWQEVAQRIAHEIRNPLTPIQLSAQRLARHLERAGTQPVDAEFSALARECTTLIEREAATLKSLVDEFSQFARFPASKPEPAEINSIVSGALEVFAGRLDGVHLRTDLSPHLPQVKADPELMRRVLVNLVDNAAEAMEGATYKELTVATRLVSDGDTVEIVVADSGHGISPEDKDKLFLPRFSTRGRGTGLGLAIAARIVADHGGAIRAEDNSPVGAKFIVRLPAIEVPATQRTGDD